MKSLLISGAFAAFSLFGLNSLQAQHLHAHGNHYDVHQNVPHGHDAAGHLTDRAGHHINGDGYHTGSTGVYENGSYSTPSVHNHYQSYSTPSYVSPSYVTPTYSSTPNVIYSSPSVMPSSTVISAQPTMPSQMITQQPMPSQSIVTSNKIPASGGNSIPSASGGSGRQIVLSNPAQTGGTISYTLNTFPYSISPGQSQTVNLDRDWVIKFDNGLGKMVGYQLGEGKYEFAVSPQTGWNVVRSRDDAPLAAPSLPQNSLPNSVPSSLGMAPPPSTLP